MSILAPKFILPIKFDSGIFRFHTERSGSLKPLMPSQDSANGEPHLCYSNGLCLTGLDSRGSGGSGSGLAFVPFCSLVGSHRMVRPLTLSSALAVILE